MSIVYVGIDLAKNVFAVHGVDEAGKPALVRPAVARAKLHELIASFWRCPRRSWNLRWRFPQ
jgi:transposase